ncbi:MAG: MBL fold metallo-hydrolase, partial [Bacteroidia bacterium]
MPFELNILGSSSAVPTKDRNQTALVLDLGYQSVLFDAGEGVQKQFIIRNLKPHKIKYVVISHLHPDHFIGLIGLLCSWGLMGRHHKLTIIAPDGLQEIINLQLNTSGIKLSFEVEFIIPPIA